MGPATLDNRQAKFVQSRSFNCASFAVQTPTTQVAYSELEFSTVLWHCGLAHSV